MKKKDLCLSLAQCETETQVIACLRNEGLWEDPGAWQLFGGNQNNFSTIGNQASRPETALIEKIINSVDAVMMAACLSRGGNPQGPDAPDSIARAQEKYFRIPDGKLSNLTLTERAKLSDHICVVATGAKSIPCYTIIDRGEGQSPNRLSDTILSIGRDNKLRIPFVQGKFNMGGTGVFQFCGGHHNVHLIISRRHPQVAEREGDSRNEWGFTIVRREDPGRGVRNSVYKYLAPGGNIIAFAAPSLRLLPGEYPEAHAHDLEWGTFIKLFEYQMTGLKTNVLFDLYNRLSLLMPAIALPVRLYERRRGYSGHSFETTLSGLTVRLDEDKRDNLEDGFPTSSQVSVQGQPLKVSIFAFKRGKCEKYSKDEGIIFSVNGQTHGHLSKQFFSRQAVRMGYLSDSILVLADCSDFDGRAREDLFMNSRDRLRSGDMRSQIERELEDLLKNHQGLKDLRERRVREDVETKLEDSKPLAEVINTILRRSPTLSKLFIEGVRLQYPFKLTGASTSSEYSGRRFPSYFKLRNGYGPDHLRKCPINRKIRLMYRTDAQNDYFTRDSDPGQFTLELSGTSSQDFSLNLWNGTAYLAVGLPDTAKPGDVLCFASSVSDVGRVDPFAEEFRIEIVTPVETDPHHREKHNKPPSNEPGDDSESTTYLDLPNVVEVRRDEWSKYKFDQDSALVIKDTGQQGFVFFVNMDNIHLKTEQKANSSADPKLLDARYKYALVLLGIALLRDIEKRNVSQGDNADEEEESAYDAIAKITRMISPVILPMIDGLGDLVLEDTSESYSEE